MFFHPIPYSERENRKLLAYFILGCINLLVNSAISM